MLFAAAAPGPQLLAVGEAAGMAAATLRGNQQQGFAGGVQGIELLQGWADHMLAQLTGTDSHNDLETR